MDCSTMRRVTLRRIAQQSIGTNGQWPTVSMCRYIHLSNILTNEKDVGQTTLAPYGTASRQTLVKHARCFIIIIILSKVNTTALGLYFGASAQREVIP